MLTTITRGIGIAATVIIGSIASLSISPAGTARSANTPDSSPTHTVRAVPGAYLGFDRRPGHHRRYYATVVAASPVAVDSLQRWVVHITSRRHRNVLRADVTARVSMPETEDASPSTTTARYLGAGRYAIDGIRFTRSGQWTVALTIRGSRGADSLAFNVVLPD